MRVAVDSFIKTAAAAALLAAFACGNAAAQEDLSLDVPLIGQNGAPMSEYWLGVSCTTIKNELQHDDAQGVVVHDVVPDSPAAKAGLQKDDVLIAVGDDELHEPRDLVLAVQAAKDKEMKLLLFRAGEKKEIAITPAKRPAAAIDQPAAGRFNVRIVHPGQLLARGMALAAPRHDLPEDMTVTIIKAGTAPARIRIHQGENSWETTEEKLDLLPDEIRPHAEAMLGRFTLPITSGVGNVLTYVPNANAVDAMVLKELRNAKPEAALERDPLAAQRRMHFDVTGLPPKAEEVEEYRQALQNAARDLLFKIDRRGIAKAQEAGRAAAEAAGVQGQAAVDKAVNWLLEQQLEEKIDAVDRQLDELRTMVRAMRESRKAAALEPAPEPAQAPAPDKAEAESGDTP